MNDPKWGSMNESDFEALLQNSLSGLPPEDVVEAVTPWRRAMGRVLVGMALCAITLNVWHLDTVLPAAGMVLSLLGFRMLRRENPWFRCCFWITVSRVVCCFPALILNTTIFQSAILTPSVTSALTAVNLLLPLAASFCLWRGLRAVQKKAGLAPQAGGAAALTIWYALLCLLAVIRYDGPVLAVAMILGYGFLLWKLYQLSKELDEAGYAIQPALIRVTDRWVVLALLAVLTVGCALGYLFGDHYSMDWRPVEPAEQTDVAEIGDHLLALGFPEAVLQDLMPEDIAACDGASRVVVTTTVKTVKDGTETTTARPKNQLRITGIGVQLPGEREKWMIFHHFLWMTDPGFYGTESIQLWPVYRDLAEGWASAGEVTGRVLYDADGETFAAPYHSLGEQTVPSNSIFGGGQTGTDVFATFSMPRQGENHRGYVAYPILERRDGYIIHSWFNYTHQQSWLQYPAMTAMESRMTDPWNRAGAFITIQDAFQIGLDETDSRGEG